MENPSADIKKSSSSKTEKNGLQEKSVDVKATAFEEKLDEDDLSILQNEDICNELLYFVDNFKKLVGRMIRTDLRVGWRDC